SLTEHYCPSTKTWHNDERTVAAYRTVLSNRLNKNCMTLAQAYALTGEDRFAQPVRTALLKLVRIYPTLQRHDRWGRTGLLAVVGGRRYCQNLSEGIGAIELAKAYDLMCNAPCMSDTDRRSIERDFLGATAREILRYGVFSGSRNNHRTWFNATFMVVGLAIGDAKLIQESLTGSAGLHQQIRNSITDDGLWFEGTNAYHFYALQAIIEHLEAAKRIGVNLSENERLKRMWLGPASLTYPDGSIPVINDSDPANLKRYKKFFKWGHDYFKDPALAELAGLSAATRNKAGGLKSTALRAAGLVMLRRGRGENASCVVLDYGIHGGGHGHPDKLNMNLYALGREIILDPGRISYRVPEYKSWARTTIAHNTVVVGGQNQNADNGRLLFFKETPAYAAALAESRGAYRGRTLKRFLVLTDTILVDVFVVAGKHKATLDWIVHPRGDLQTLVSFNEHKTALGTRDGYGHLLELQKGTEKPHNQFRVTKGKKTLWIHTLNEPGDELYTGMGIGYHRKDQVPFLLRRRSAATTVFLTLYDLTGNGSSLSTVQAVPVREDGKPLAPYQAIGLKLTTPASTALIGLDLGATEGKTLEVEGQAFTRLHVSTPSK
ncbi:MAG: heparinase II/III domain-containing protein, partial [Planctomycetota bacterium]